MALLRQQTIAGRGRGLVATARLQAGKVLLRESPLLFYEEAEAAESAAFCSHCLRLLTRRQTVSCSDCNAATFCNTTCLQSGHARTCKGITALKKKKLEFSQEEQTLARFLIAAYNLDPESFAKLLELEGQEQDEDVVKKLHAFVAEEVLSPDVHVTVETTRELLARDACNTFGLMAPSKPGEERKVRGYAMYAQASMFNHDCLPNACRFEYVDRDGDGNNTDVIVRALHDIDEGSEVCLSYFAVDWAYGDRQKKLHDEYGFWCKCARCVVESEWKEDDDDDDIDDNANGNSNDNDNGNDSGNGNGYGNDSGNGNSNGNGNGDGDVGESDEELEVAKGDVKEDDEDDFGHAMFFVKYLCPVEECGGTMAPLPPGELDAQGLEGSMECNFCGHVRSDEEFHRDLEEHAVGDDDNDDDD